MTEFENGWNAAIAEAQRAIVKAPIFPKKDSGAIADGERIMILEICREQVDTLAIIPDTPAN
jgi:hypothetical protein